jgi:hypothetical protein
MTDFKKIFKPLDVNESMEGWLLHSHKGRDRHDQSARYFEKKNSWLGIPTIILSAITGTTIFASLATQDKMLIWVKIIVGLLSVSAAVLASLQTFYNYHERAEKHRSTGVKYKEVIRSIEKNTLARGFSQQEIDNIYNRLNEIEESAPVVPDVIYSKIESQYKQVIFVEKADQLYESEK